MGRIGWNQPPETGNVEFDSFMADLFDVIKNLDRQTLEDLSSVGETAGATYGANEQTMLENLKTLANGLKANL